MMNTNQVRVIDPILTSVVQGFLDAEFIGHVLFPRVPVAQRGGQIIEFGKEHFRLSNMRRAPGAETKRVEFGFGKGVYAVVQDSLEAIVAREHQQEANAGPNINLAERSVNVVMRKILRGLENEQAAAARNAAAYAASNKLAVTGNDKWTDPDSDPVAQMDSAKEAVRAKIGTYPNTLVLSPKTFLALKNHPKLIDRFKFTSSAVITEQMLAALFDIAKVVVGKSIAAGDDDVFYDLWGNDAILAYVPANPAAEEPGYGYTYALDGNPFVEAPYWDNNRKSWVYGVTYERAPVIACADAAFLFQGAV